MNPDSEAKDKYRKFQSKQLVQQSYKYLQTVAFSVSTELGTLNLDINASYAYKTISPFPPSNEKAKVTELLS